jgi:signal peptidase II
MEPQASTRRRHLAGPLLLAVIVFLLDQSAKAMVQETLGPWDKVTVIPGFFNLVHVLNKGAAFGIFNEAGSSWQTLFFIGATLLAVCLIGYILLSTNRRDRLFLLGFGAILGGALGNLADRVRLGMVVDYLDFYLGSFHWPAFNVADTAITLGALSLLISMYRKEDGAAKSQMK